MMVNRTLSIGILKNDLIYILLETDAQKQDRLFQHIYEDIAIITDEEALRTSKDLARLEGLMCGISSGTNVAAAIKLARKLGPGKTVVTILPDTAERYFSTPLFGA